MGESRKEQVARELLRVVAAIDRSHEDEAVHAVDLIDAAAERIDSLYSVGVEPVWWVMEYVAGPPAVTRSRRYAESEKQRGATVIPLVPAGPPQVQEAKCEKCGEPLGCDPCDREAFDRAVDAAAARETRTGFGYIVEKVDRPPLVIGDGQPVDEMVARLEREAGYAARESIDGPIPVEQTFLWQVAQALRGAVPSPPPVDAERAVGLVERLRDSPRDDHLPDGSLRCSKCYAEPCSCGVPALFFNEIRKLREEAATALEGYEERVRTLLELWEKRADRYRGMTRPYDGGGYDMMADGVEGCADDLREMLSQGERE